MGILVFGFVVVGLVFVLWSCVRINLDLVCVNIEVCYISCVDCGFKVLLLLKRFWSYVIIFCFMFVVVID